MTLSMLIHRRWLYHAISSAVILVVRWLVVFRFGWRDRLVLVAIHDVQVMVRRSHIVPKKQRGFCECKGKFHENEKM